MKKFIKLTALAVASLCVAAFTASAGIGTYYGGTVNPLNSQLGYTNYTTQPTNGAYPQGILAGSTIGNIIPINTGNINPGTGNTFVLTFTGQSSANTTSTTNVTAIIYACAAGENPVFTNNAAGGFNTNAGYTPLSYYTTVTLTLPAGAAYGSTNIVLTPESTPLFSGGLKLYLYSLQYAGASGSGFLFTNYDFWVTQN